MDGISGAAAVIGLVQAATQVTTALGRYVSSVRGAESSRAKLLAQIKLISAAEKTMETAIRNSPRSSREPELQAMVDEWFRADAFPSKCKGELEKLLHWLERQDNRKRNKWGNMVVWPVKEDKIQATIQAFEAYMPYFHYIVSNESLSLVQSIAVRNKSDDLDVAKLKILQWLDGVDCTDKHENTREQRQKTTGAWLFKEQFYIDWRRCSTKFFWLHGKAGAGKSVLASAVIDDLLYGLSNDETVAYFYCDFRNPRCTSAVEVLRSLAKQLLTKSKNDWLSSFSDLTTRMQQGAVPPTSLGALSDLLEQAAELHEQPIIVVDALDECEDLPRLLSGLVRLTHGHCRSFVTSRTLHVIEEAFAGLPSISLEERVDEVRNDMHFHIKTELESRSRLKILVQDLKDEIQSVLMKKADGMFRWVRCQLDRLNDCYSLGDVREVLDTLPATLYETYDQMLHAIDKKPFGPRIARRALTWLVTALRPLRLSQLAEAMSISFDKPERDAAIAPMHESVILDILGSLVTVNHRGNITLSHYSVKEYLTSETIAHSTYFIHRPSASLELATVSIFSLILSSDESETTVEARKVPLYWYAGSYGLRHLADCHSEHNESLVKHLLTLQNHISIHHHIYEHHWWINAWMIVTAQPALYIIIRFGHTALLRHYLDCCPARATEEDNPLVFAALYSDIPRVQLLLGNGLDVNRQGLVHAHQRTRKMTPLTAAARNEAPENQESLVKLLLENGCVISRDAIHSILLCNLGVPCQPAVVRILLKHGADPLWLSAEGRSCLHLALSPRVSSDDEFEIARTLITAGCDPMALDYRGHSSFQLAIRSLSTELVGWLLRCGFQLPSPAILDAISSPGLSVPFLGLPKKLLCMLQFLVRNGADADAQDAHGCNALHLFSGRILLFDNESIEGILRLLIEHGCDINCHNDAGETPLHLAATSYTFNSHILDLFLARGAELPVDIVNYAVRSFGYPSVSGQDEQVAITTLTCLVKKFGASCRSQTVRGDNALHCLLGSKGSSTEVVMDLALFLLENGCDARAPNSSGQTSLQLAIENGYFLVARNILAQITGAPYYIDDTKQYHGDTEGNGILHRLCDGTRNDQFEDIMRLLREAGYDSARDINRPNNKGFTPLCIALKTPFYDPGIVSHLLGLGASFCHVDPLYLDNLELGAANLPWYDDATDAHERRLSRSRITREDVIRVHHLLRVVHPGLSSTLTRCVLDMAEYWVCRKVTRNNARYSITSGGELASFPAVPGQAGCWIPRRVVFACKAGVSELYTGYDSAWIRVDIKRAGAILTVPISFRIRRDPPNPPRTEFDVWDEFSPAVQENGRQRLMVGDLLPGDTLSVEFCEIDNDYLILDFFQIEVYYSMKPPARATSGDL